MNAFLFTLSPVILLCVKLCVSVFPSGVWEGLWVLIRSVSKISVHIDFDVLIVSRQVR